MTNNKELENISSMCTTPEELIKSGDFMRGVEIILGQVKAFNKEYILGLFTKLQNDEVLDEEEKETLLKFVGDNTVAEKGQELLSKLKNLSVNVKTNNTSELISFTELLNNIFEKDGLKKVQSYVGEVADITELTLKAYEGFTKRKLEIKNEDGQLLETKEIYVEDENLKLLDDSILIYKYKDGTIANYPIEKAKENPLLITKEKEGDYKFGWEAAMLEAKKQGKLVPTQDELVAIIKSIGVEKMKGALAGDRYTDGSTFNSRGNSKNFWSSSEFDASNARGVLLGRYNSTVNRTYRSKLYGFSVRCTKD